MSTPEAITARGGLTPSTLNNDAPNAGQTTRALNNGATPQVAHNAAQWQAVLRQMTGGETVTNTSANMNALIDGREGAPNIIERAINFVERLFGAGGASGDTQPVSVRADDALHSIGTGFVSAIRGAWMNTFEGAADVVAGIARPVVHTFGGLRDAASGVINLLGGGVAAAKIPTALALNYFGIRNNINIGQAGENMLGRFADARRDFRNAADHFAQIDLVGSLKQIGMGFIKTFVQTPVDAFLMVAGRTISAIQTLSGREPVGRELSPTEITELRRVYGDSIDYSRVRIKEGDAGLFSRTRRAFTLGDTIYIPPNNLEQQTGRVGTNLLVHEMAHVWQHQNGGTDYMSEALWAQNFGDGYKFEHGLLEGRAFHELNPEQQAEMLQRAHRFGYFDHPEQGFRVQGIAGQSEEFIDGITRDYTRQLEQALLQIRNGQGAP